jgi:hypothetical protein
LAKRGKKEQNIEIDKENWRNALTQEKEGVNPIKMK